MVKSFLKRAKKEFPETWEECIKIIDKGEFISSDSCVLGTGHLSDISSNFDIYYNTVPIGLAKPFLALCKLLTCREVYRKGWKPDWNDGLMKYVIYAERGNLDRGIAVIQNYVLSFQDENTRDKFYNNFLDLIKQAKELI